MLMASEQAQNGVFPRIIDALVANIVDERAKTTPHALYAEYPNSALTYEEGYRKFTYRDLANAVNGIAWWLHNNLGPGKEFEVLAYIGPNDLRYPALILGAAKAGYVVFLASPRNSLAAQMNLLDRVKCNTLLSPHPPPAPVTAILGSREMRTCEVPSVGALLDNDHPPFPYEKNYLQALSEPFFVVHTSGSTGIPKPIVFTHATMAKNTKMMSLDPPPGFESQDRMIQGKRIFLTFPPFHGASLVSHLCHAISFGAVMIAPTSGAIPSVEGLVEGMKKTPVDIAFIVPSIVQELSQTPQLLGYCSENLQAIIYCGGDLPQAIGNVVASKVRLLNQFGATELGLTTNILSKTHRGREDWKYVEFHPETGVELRHVANETYELYVVRDPKKEQQQPTFTLFPDKSEYASRDLFTRHPSKDKPNMWSWRARADDIVVFLNGEKTNPISMEQHIVSRNTRVAAVLVAGAQRFQAALLIEPMTKEKNLSVAERAAFIEDIWPTIEEANKDAPSHARIERSHILFTALQKPMLRAGKGTVQRSGTLKLYAGEIEGLYRDAETLTADVGEEDFGNISNLDGVSVARFIKRSILSITNWPDLDDKDNIFAHGMDSLQALMLVRKLKQGLAIPNIALSTIYTSPSVHNLAEAVIRLSTEHQTSQRSDEEARLETRDGMLKEYQGLIGRIPKSSGTAGDRGGEVIVLTGSTGALGLYILDRLYSDLDIVHIYCLNRVSDDPSQRRKRAQARRRNTEFNPDKVTFLTTDLSQRHLGLQSEVFDKLLDTATLVIHNAWPVNFNLSLPSFRPQLDGLVNLIAFTAAATTSANFLFVSSISSVMSYRSASSKTPEEIISDISAPGPNGYAESKYLAERLLDHAAQKLSIKLSVARVGQIAGAVELAGLWNKAEWFPSLVLSSLQIGSLPDTLGPSLSKIDWVPIDLLAEILVELALPKPDASQPDGSSESHIDPGMAQRRPLVFHLVNPHPTDWKSIRPTVTENLSHNTETPMETIPLRSWLERVRQDMELRVGNGNGDDLKEAQLQAALEKNPAVKLLDFYGDVLGAETGLRNELDLVRTASMSPKLRSMECINAAWIQKWVREWIDVVTER